MRDDLVILPAVVVGVTFVVMLAAWLFAIHHYAANWPFWDELSYLSYTVGARPLTWQLLWEHHNGHRLLIPKVVYFSVMKMSGYQPTVLMYMSLGLLALGAACVIAALRRVCGRLHVLDAVLVLAALTFSQYFNLLWAFQIWVTISGALILVAIASVVRVQSSADHRFVILLGVITALLPLCGGPGMGMAPGFILWLLGAGVVHGVRGVERRDRVFAAWAVVSGLTAAGTWGVAVSGLPPSSALAMIREAFQSWRAFVTFVTHLYGTTVEFLSTPFVPESVYRALPFLYDGSTWGHWGLFMLGSVAGVLLWAWIRRPRERLRISAIAGSLIAFVSLILVLYFSRGIYGIGAGASARYSTFAMPLLVMAVVTYALYAPRLFRFAVLGTTAVALVGLLWGPYGNLAKLEALASFERDSFHKFESMLSRPGGTTIEELAGHFSAALFEPGEARQVPGFIQVMAEHRIGPFRTVPGIPPQVSDWKTSPFPITTDAAYGTRWDGKRALKPSNVHGVISVRPHEPTPLAALRLTFRVKAPSAGVASIFLSWHAFGTEEPVSAHPIRWVCPISESLVHTATAYIFATIDQLDIGLGGGFTEWELLNSERLEPTGTSASAPVTRH